MSMSINGPIDLHLGGKRARSPSPSVAIAKYGKYKMKVQFKMVRMTKVSSGYYIVLSVYPVLLLITYLL